jgi:restriction endonuclease S subunit
MELRPGYKQTGLGVIPEEWAVRSFDQTLKRQNAKAFQIQTASYQTSGSLPVVDQGQKAVVGYSDQIDRRFECPPEGVIVFGDHTCIVKFVDFDFVVGADGTQLLTVKGDNSTRFYAYSLEHKGVLATGYNRHFKFLKERSFACPSLPEQRAIATALSDVDELLSGLDRLIAKKRNIKKAVMQELLTGKTRLPGFHGEWEAKTLRKVFEIAAGKSKSAHVADDGDFVICDMGSVSTDGRMIKTKRTNYRGDLLLKGDLVMPKDDIGGGKIIGKVAYVDRPDAYVLGDHVYRLRALEGDPMFMAYLINSPAISSAFRKKAAGSAQLGLSRRSVEDQEIPFPHPDEQAAIAEVLTDMDEELSLLEKRREKTRNIKQAMMQELLTGKTRLV